MEELLGVLLIGTVGAWAYREMRGRNNGRREQPKQKVGAGKKKRGEPIGE